ncbi:Ppx/GppA phosphatase family protein [Denitrobaculum tricleocarpae]|uniref:Ppx/GppA phosphatase family protein n=1 Tax=Denitrobaculum tricleocarpae TaxID=2591009 RepID=UPI001C556267|nr:Ppx/GppA phosphatase family protein [Denitrobaculum tricleocarpae]
MDAGAENGAGTGTEERVGIGRIDAAATLKQKPGRGIRGRVFGALDLGTNNCRLLVAKPARQGYRVVDSFSRVVRLGEGLSHSDVLSEAAMERTLRALKICSSKMQRLGVTEARCVATAACRRAVNYPAFRDRVEAEFGLKLEVISSREETRLAVYGCAPLFDPDVETALVFDIGGGSTEVCWVALPGHPNGHARPGNATDAQNASAVRPGRRSPIRHGQAIHPKVLAWKSLPMGVTNLAERYGGGDISETSYRKMVADVLDSLDPFERENGILGSVTGRKVQMLGTSGTVTTLVGIKKDLARYDRRRVDGCYLSLDSVEGLNRRVAAMSYDERVAHPCIGRHRADLVVAGCAILDALCRTWPVDRLRVADRGLREGIIFTLMQGL